MVIMRLVVYMLMTLILTFQTFKIRIIFQVIPTLKMESLLRKVFIDRDSLICGLNSVLLSLRWLYNSPMKQIRDYYWCKSCYIYPLGWTWLLLIWGHSPLGRWCCSSREEHPKQPALFQRSSRIWQDHQIEYGLDMRHWF